MIDIDGSEGEGGGQILRTSLALSLVTGKPFRMRGIRAGRAKPGLQRQHLAAVGAARSFGNAAVAGDTLGSRDLEFRPGQVVPGDHRIPLETAGSTTLVLQAVLPALLTASGPSSIALEGGTHNPFAPPFDFLARSFAPAVERMGPRLKLELGRPGFYPAGAGRFAASIVPSTELARVDLLERGAVVRRRARAIVARLPMDVASRELAAVRASLGWNEDECFAEVVPNPVGTGNALVLEIECANGTAVFSAIGQRGRPSETVAREAADAAAEWLRADVPVDEHLADQLIVPMALAGGGSFRTTRPSSHTVTNAGTIERFLPVRFSIERESELVWRVSVDSGDSGISTGQEEPRPTKAP